MKSILLPICLLLMLCLTGCSLFGWYANGDVYSHPTTEENDWTKPNTNEAQRKSDWISCGGNSAGHITFSEQKNGQSLTDHTIQVDKETDAAQACMMKKGYRYTSSCRGESSRRIACKGRSIFNL